MDWGEVSLLKRRWLGVLVTVLAAALVATAVAIPAGSSLAATNATKYTKAVVVDVIDGDTIAVKWLAGPKLPSSRVRLIGVNAPESTTRVEPYGKEATNFTRKQLKGRTVWLEKDVSEKDRYGRALRYVWLTPPPAKPTSKHVRKYMFNAKLVAAGYAQVATFPPDVRWANLFVQLQREAQAAKNGLWRKRPSTVPAGAIKGNGGYHCPKGYPIKGNISSKGEKIYHVPTGAYYKKTKPEFCFRSEKDAQRSGFRRSLR